MSWCVLSWDAISDQNNSPIRMNWRRRHAIAHHDNSPIRMNWRKRHAMAHHNISAIKMHWLEGHTIDQHNMNRQGCIDENGMRHIWTNFKFERLIFKGFQFEALFQRRFAHCLDVSHVEKFQIIRKYRALPYVAPQHPVLALHMSKVKVSKHSFQKPLIRNSTPDALRAMCRLLSFGEISNHKEIQGEALCRSATSCPCVTYERSPSAERLIFRNF